jgi:alpha-mannosidase/mannosylglycerate hydrolase
MVSRPVHYVLSTHWDREWYRTFQDFRFRLVQLLDRVFEGWESGELKGPFQTDGQAIILDDYLEIHPEKREQVKQYLKEGKLVAGPWYVLPDEFIVSGESLIRNLLYGRQVVRSLGGVPSNAGFMCDLFGQNSQMPQIFADFGIHGAFIWRGLNELQRMVRWKGADGTEIASYRFGRVGYCDYAVRVRHGDNPRYVVGLEQTADEITTFLDEEAGKNEVEPILLFDGGDHMQWDKEVYKVLALLMDQDKSPYQIKHTSLDGYLAEMLPQSRRITTTISGELRDPGTYPLNIDQQWVIPGVLSSRVWIKQLNAACQTLLCNWAEPISTAAQAWLGYDYPQGYLEVAWKWLLSNHPHDSICGCSIDAVHEDMRYRFHQCQGIAERLTSEAALHLAASIQDEPGSNELRVVVFNPLPVPYNQAAELTLDLPVEWPTFNEFFGYEPKPAFRIYDETGKEAPYQRLGQTMNQTRLRSFDARFPQTLKVNAIKVSLPLQIPAMGYTTLTVRAGQAGIPIRYPEVPGMATSERSMSNGILSVTIESNGTLSVTDLRSGQMYQRMLTFEDRADIGDGWYHGIAANDQTFLSSACSAAMALVHSGPLLTTFRIRTTMNLPAEFDFTAMQRSAKTSDLVIDSLVSLRRGSDRIEVETRVHNTVGDHRLRVLFPTSVQTDTFLTDTPFDVVERRIALSPENHLYRELEVETRPQQTWSAIYQQPRGLAVVSTGLMEVAVQDLPERPVALTLFRSTRRTVFTEIEPLGQLFGDMTFHYWILPLATEPDRTALCNMGQAMAVGVRTIQMSAVDVKNNRLKDNLPLSASFLKVEGPVVMTSLREVESGMEVRMFNPNPTTVKARLDFSGQPAIGRRFTTARQVDFESHPKGPVNEFDGKVLPVELGPKQIATLRFE